MMDIAIRGQGFELLGNLYCLGSWDTLDDKIFNSSADLAENVVMPFAVSAVILKLMNGSAFIFFRPHFGGQR